MATDDDRNPRARRATGRAEAPRRAPAGSAGGRPTRPSQPARQSRQARPVPRESPLVAAARRMAEEEAQERARRQGAPPAAASPSAPPGTGLPPSTAFPHEGPAPAAGDGDRWAMVEPAPAAPPGEPTAPPPPPWESTAQLAEAEEAAAPPRPAWEPTTPPSAWEPSAQPPPAPAWEPAAPPPPGPPPGREATAPAAEASEAEERAYPPPPAPRTRADIPPAPGQPSYSLWWRRVAAALIDGAILGVPAAIIYAVAGANALDTDPLTGDTTFEITGAYTAASLIVLVCSLAYYAFLEGGPAGATVGKMALGIQLRDAASLGPVGYGRALGRRLVASLLWALFVIPGILDVLSPLWDPRRQTWHDKALDTVVVDRA